MIFRNKLIYSTMGTVPQFVSSLLAWNWKGYGVHVFIYLSCAFWHLSHICIKCVGLHYTSTYTHTIKWESIQYGVSYAQPNV